MQDTTADAEEENNSFGRVRGLAGHEQLGVQKQRKGQQHVRPGTTWPERRCARTT